MRYIRLRDAVFVRHFESETTAFVPIEQCREDRGLIEVGETQPFDIPFFRYERCRPAVSNYTIVEVIHRFYFKFSSSLKKCNAEFNPFRTLSLVDDSPEIFTNVCNKGRTCSCDGKLYLAVSET